MLCDVQAAGDVHSRSVSLRVVRRRAVGVHVQTIDRENLWL